MAQPTISRFFTSAKEKSGLKKPETEKSVISQKFAFSTEDAEPARPEQVEPPAKRPKKDSSRVKKKSEATEKLTPLEQQFVDLKKSHSDKILAIQVGYKFKFFGQDGVVASKILNIMLVPGKISHDVSKPCPNDSSYSKFAYCSIPDNRLHIHLKRLLNKGLKVGVVEQLETAAIKQNSANKSSLFERKLTNVYTSATYIDIEESDSDLLFNRSGNYIICLFEKENEISIVAVQLLTGEVVYDHFQDDFLRSLLDTRISHLSPIEFIILGKCSKATDKIVSNYRRSAGETKIQVSNKPVRPYDDYVSDIPDLWQWDMEFLLSFPQPLQVVYLELVTYLEEFQMSSIFGIRDNFKAFHEIEKSMILDSNVMKSLEIFSNSSDGSERGSLIWLLNHTRTKFGYRMLKRWISQPLTEKHSICQRSDAVKEILEKSDSSLIEYLCRTLSTTLDLQKSIARIHYHRAARKETYLILKAFTEVINYMQQVSMDSLAKFESPYLLSVLTDMKSACDSLSEFSLLVDMIYSPAAMDERDLANQKISYFNKHFFANEKIQERKDSMAQVESNLQKQLLLVRQYLKRPSMEFVTNLKETHLIEVRNSQVKSVPQDWIKINSTKSVSRFRSPEIVRLHKQLQYNEELLIKQTDDCFDEFLQRIDSHHHQLNKLVSLLATLDCIFSLSACSANIDYCQPEFVDGQMVLLEGSRNPILETLSSNYICNDFEMTREKNRVAILTGANMGGKSCFIRQIALTVIMAQIGCFVPASKATLGIFQSIFIRMGSHDDMVKGKSTFQVELEECSTILEKCDSQSLVLLDEIGRGTSTVDGYAIAHSVLDYLIACKSPFIIFITHYPGLADFDKLYATVVKNFHMGYKLVDEKDHSELVFLYTIAEGVCGNSFGLNVARIAHVPAEVVEQGLFLSEKLKKETEQQKSRTEGIQTRLKLKQLLSERVSETELREFLNTV